MACIIRDNNGNPTGATANNGNRSILFDDLLKKTPEIAEDAYAITQSIEFKEEVVKPQIKSHRNKINILYSQPVQKQIISERGAKNILKYKESLDKAKELEKKGVSLSDISDQTGWYKFQGNWRMFSKEALEQFNVKEDKIKVNETQKLTDILDPENILFKMYPSLLDIMVTFNNNEVSQEKNASFVQDRQLIIINNFFGREGKAALAHELSHAIQSLENLPRGGSSKSYFRNLLVDLGVINKTNENLPNHEVFRRLYNARNSKNLEKVNEALRLMEALSKNDSAGYKTYRAIMGEIDAHMVTDAYIAYNQGDIVDTYEVMLEDQLYRNKIDENSILRLDEDGLVYYTPPTKPEPQLLNQVVEQLKKTGLANEVFQLSNQEMEAKLIELGVDANIAKQVVYRSIRGQFDPNYKGIQYYAENEAYAKLFGSNTKKFDLNTSEILDLEAWNKELGLEDAGMFGQGYLTIHETSIENPSEWMEQLYMELLEKGVSDTKAFETAKRFKKAIEEAKVIKGQDIGNKGEVTYAVKDPSLVEALEDLGISSTFGDISSSNEATMKKIERYKRKTRLQLQKTLSEKGVSLTTAGFVHNNNVYLNKDQAALDTPIHEFGHLYLNKLKQDNIALYNKGLSLVKTNKAEAQPYIDYVKETQPNLREGTEAFNEEVLAQAIGDNGARLINTNKKDSIKQWLQDLWNTIKEMVGLSQMTADQVANMSLLEFSQAVSVDLLRGEVIKGNQAQEYFIRNADRLPLTLSVFSRPEFVKLQGKQVNPITVLNSLNQTGIKQIEKDLIKKIIEENYQGQKRISYDELEATVRANIMPLERIFTSSYADYGMDNLGDGNYGEANTIILNAPIEHGVTGHFSGDFKASGRQNIKYEAKQLNDNTWVAVEEGYESQANDNNIYQYVGTAGTKEAVDAWIESYSNGISIGDTVQVAHSDFGREYGVVKVINGDKYNIEVNGEMYNNIGRDSIYGTENKAINKGMFGHIRVWQDGQFFYVAEFQSDYFQKNNARKYIIENSKEYQKIVDKYKTLYKEKEGNRWNDIRSALKEGGYTRIYEESTDTTKLLLNGVILYEEMYDQSLTNLYNRYVKENGTKNILDAINAKYEEIQKNNDKQKNIEIGDLYKNLSPQEKQFIASQKIWEQRVVREAIKEAALSGATELRFPTPYTLSVIEGYIRGNEATETAPYQILEGDSNSLKEGDVINYLDKEYIIVEANENTIKIVEKEQDDITKEIVDDIIVSKGSEQFIEENKINDDKYIYKGFYLGDKGVLYVEKVKKPDDYETNEKYFEEGLFESQNLTRASYFEKYREEIEDVVGKMTDKEFLEFIEDSEIQQQEKVNLSLENASKDFNGQFELPEYSPTIDEITESVLDYTSSYKVVDNRVYSTESAETLKQPDKYTSQKSDGFDIATMLSEQEQTVARKYEQIAEILKQERGDNFEVVTDENGFDWYQTKISTSEINKPVVAFQKAQPRETKVVEVNGRRTIQMFEGGQMLGYVRMLPFQDGMQVEASNLSANTPQGQGIGTELYKAAVKDTIDRGIPLYSDQFQTPAAKGVWNKLIELGIAEIDSETGRMKANPNPPTLDRNGEPKSKDVYEYIHRNNSDGIEVTKEDRVQIIKAAIGMESTDQLLTMLMDAFYKDGLFSPNKTSLKRNGYTEAEATAILTDLSLQSQIKDTIDKIQALPSPINLEDMQAPPRVFLSLVPNAIGKLQAENPYLLEQEIIDTLGGIKTKEDFDLAVEESGMEVAKDRFEELSQYTEIPVMEVTEEGELVNKPLNNTAEVLTETLTEAPNNNLRDKIDFILTLPDEITLNEQEDVNTLLEDIRAEAIEIGLDLEGITEQFNEKPLLETKEFLQSIKTLLREGRTGIQTFSESYNNYFGIDTEAVRTTKQLNVTPNTIRVENTSKTAYDMFTEHGLLYLGNSLYKRVNNRKTKEELYAAMSTRTELFPNNIFDGINMTNTAAVTEAIRKHTEKQIAKMETSENVDADMMEAFYLNSVFFGSPINVEVKVKPVSQVNNAEYLTDEFIADFNKKKLKEKLKDSAIYNDFYKNTIVNKNGIEFISTDPISMRLAQEYMDDTLKDYLSIKKDSNVEIPTEEQSLEDENFVNRNKYINFAQSLPKLTKPYSRVNENTIRIEDSNDNFVRIKDGVYELIQQNGTDSYYYKLPNNTSNYVMVFEDIQLPTQIETPQRDTVPTEPEIKITNLFTKQEESKINEALECN